MEDDAQTAILEQANIAVELAKKNVGPATGTVQDLSVLLGLLKPHMPSLIDTRSWSCCDDTRETCGMQGCKRGGASRRTRWRTDQGHTARNWMDSCTLWTTLLR